MNNNITTFIGVDLAWRTGKNPSGIAVAQGNSEGAELICHHANRYSLVEISDIILSLSTDNTVIAVDAPLIINNQTGRRPCETQISEKYGNRHASTHSSNLTLYPDAESVQFAKNLERYGFSQDIDPHIDIRRGGRWFFEAYTHSAYVVLFDLPRIIQYKKGRVADKKRGLTEFRRLLWEKLTVAEPPLRPTTNFKDLTHIDLSPTRGKALKNYEDTLDAVLCAYITLFYWRWGSKKNEMFGDLDSGIIINPTTSLRLKYS